MKLNLYLFLFAIGTLITVAGTFDILGDIDLLCVQGWRKYIIDILMIISGCTTGIVGLNNSLRL